MSRNVAIIQARFASTRLPGKILNRLGEKTVLAHVLERCRAIDGIDEVCCATTEKPDCDLIVEEAKRAGVAIFRGSESDVLGRYYGAAKMLRADNVLRVTSDCPLVDPAVCAQVLALGIEENAAYACNNMPPTWPHGLDCEVFQFEWLERADREATDPFDREHVGPFIREHPEAKTVNLPSPEATMATHRWTLDTPADLAFFEALWPYLPTGPKAWDYRKALAIVEAHREIATINTGLDQAERPTRA
jgi:spore coat polysaccharide biosynthesis protein SpsF